jgi:oleandomycin transport system ATP-binding protein
MSEPAIVAHGLVKTFGDVRALDGIDLEAPQGQILGLLGPNGAGKTTAIRILATLLQPDAGTARVGGFDVVKQPGEVRKVIGLTGQYAAVDELLSGKENLYMIGKLLGMNKTDALARGHELLGLFDLVDATEQVVRTYSGGMRRRLDLAASMVGRPRFIYLDEPTTGLDPRSRRETWNMIEDLVSGGTTALLTTQYLDEADQLADEIVVIDHGRVIAEGTADELKSKVGEQVIEVRPARTEDLEKTKEILHRLAGSDGTVDEESQMVSVSGADPNLITEVVRNLDTAGIVVGHLALRRPSLDEVFLALTGHVAEERTDEKEPAR